MPGVWPMPPGGKHLHCTWRRLNNARTHNARQGNTSTCVEKTSSSSGLVTKSRKHIHGRGEDCLHSPVNLKNPETPPRAWRRPVPSSPTVQASGNTSTCVEKTRRRPSRSAGAWKHLHMRGEDYCGEARQCGTAETPPRAWRRPDARPAPKLLPGNTSTYVEKTTIFNLFAGVL